MEEKDTDFVKLNINNDIIVSGECYIFSTNINGDICMGDYISSSVIEGYAMKQTSDNKFNSDH